MKVKINYPLNFVIYIILRQSIHIAVSNLYLICILMHYAFQEHMRLLIISHKNHYALEELI